MLEALARAAMEAEVAAHVGAAPHERSEGRRGRRNGTKPRALRTGVGEVGLDVPQVRGREPYRPSWFNPRLSVRTFRSQRGTVTWWT